MVGSMGSVVAGMRKIGFGDSMFAASLGGLAGLTLFYGNFAPLVDPFPWPKMMTFALGLVLLGTSVGLLFRRTVDASAMIVAVYALAWALVCTSPVIHAPMSIGSWYGLSEAVSTLAGVWMLYALYRRHNYARRRTPLTSDIALRVARVVFGAACLVFGVAHFAYSAYSLAFVPTWLPARLPFVYVTGVFHVAAGVGLILGILPRLAARLEATMIILFGVLVWLPSYLAHPTPAWAGTHQNQWSETFLNFLLAGVAWLIADSLSSISTEGV
jgi:uncharacterized membrane protein